MTNAPTVAYLSHGGGPLPLLENTRAETGHQELVAHLRELSHLIPKPSAIILISAHWEEPVVTITSSAQPPLIYDYFGFPDVAYTIQYPALGEPTLANKIYSAFQKKGMDARLDNQRGFDHGMFVPLKLMYPEADIPCVQVSLCNHLDPAQHIIMGEVLATIEHENVLILGSGFSFHNIREFANHTSAHEHNVAFEAWLADTCVNSSLSQTERVRRLVEWEQAPSARYCHPREEHLLPLHVCCGAAGRASRQHVELTVLGKKVSSYLW